MEPVVSELESRHGDRVEVRVIDVYEDMDLAIEYEVRVVPTMVLLDGEGELIDRFEGYMELEEIESLLESHGIL